MAFRVIVIKRRLGRVLSLNIYGIMACWKTQNKARTVCDIRYPTVYKTKVAKTAPGKKLWDTAPKVSFMALAQRWRLKPNG